eukprot:jgi/Chlat1/7090/Chrsp57S06781
MANPPTMAQQHSGSGVQSNRVLLLCAAVLAFAIPAAGQSSISACAAVLNQGIYNSVSQSSASQSYQEFQTSLCTYKSTYTFQQYQTDSSSSSASSTWRSVEAAANYMGVFGGSVGASWGDSHLSANQFKLFQQNAAEYQDHGCSASSSSASSSHDLKYINNWVDPNIISAWQSCVKNFATGTTIQSTTGVNGDSVALNIVFDSTVSGATASLNGYSVTPAKAAACTLYGPKVTSSAQLSLVWPLATSVTYNVYCVINATGLTRAVDVFIYTSPGGYYHAILYNAPAPAQLAKLQALVNQQGATLNNRVNQQGAMLNNRINQQGAALQAASAQVGSLQALVDSFYNNGTLKANGLDLYAYDDPGTIRYTISAFKGADQSFSPSVFIIRDMMAAARQLDYRIAYWTGSIDLQNAAAADGTFPGANPVQTSVDAWNIASGAQQTLTSIYNGGTLTVAAVHSTSGGSENLLR